MIFDKDPVIQLLPLNSFDLTRSKQICSSHLESTNACLLNNKAGLAAKANLIGHVIWVDILLPNHLCKYNADHPSMSK